MYIIMYNLSNKVGNYQTNIMPPNDISISCIETKN